MAMLAGGYAGRWQVLAMLAAALPGKAGRRLCGQDATQARV
jgi:hypothetical protein